jgi:hypothetical protein
MNRNSFNNSHSKEPHEEEIHSISDDFRTSKSPEFIPTFLPDGLYLPNSKENVSMEKLIRCKFDNAYYQPLREIDWNVFVTLKFRGKKFSGLSKSASWTREHYLRDLGHEVIGELDLSSNDLQYFWAEETNAEHQAHYHVLFHLVYPDKCSLDDLRRSIEANIDPKIVQIPKSLPDQEPPHVQTVKSQDQVVRYVLKIPPFQDEPKVVGHSLKFIRFWKRHRNWIQKQAA